MAQILQAAICRDVGELRERTQRALHLGAPTPQCVKAIEGLSDPNRIAIDRIGEVVAEREVLLRHVVVVAEKTRVQVRGSVSHVPDGKHGVRCDLLLQLQAPAVNRRRAAEE